MEEIYSKEDLELAKLYIKDFNILGGRLPVKLVHEMFVASGMTPVRARLLAVEAERLVRQGR